MKARRAVSDSIVTLYVALWTPPENTRSNAVDVALPEILSISIIPGELGGSRSTRT
ncbi:hypothetical protein D3C81_1117000 [compost metagenome]